MAFKLATAGADAAINWFEDQQAADLVADEACARGPAQLRFRPTS